MPLTALFGETTILDVTVISDDEWAKVHRARPRPPLRCRDCANGMHAKVSSTGLRFFAHDREQVQCAFHGETAEHRWLKNKLCEVARTLGWMATPEAYPEQGDRGGWRADVLALSSDGTRRYVLEAQLASMTLEVGLERAAKYDDDGIASLWVTTKNAPWLFGLPGCKVAMIEWEPGAESLIATRGCARLDKYEAWHPVQVPLARLIDALFRGVAQPHTVRRLLEDLEHGERWQVKRHIPAVVLAPSSHIRRTNDAEERQRKENERLARDQAKRNAEQARWHANIEALLERQQRVLLVVLEDVFAKLEGDERVWLGVPAEVLPSIDKLAGKSALGNPKTAMSAVVWVGATRNSLRLVAVICPVASRVTEGLANSWKKRGTRVYVATPVERQRIANALGWTEQGVVLVDV